MEVYPNFIRALELLDIKLESASIYRDIDIGAQSMVSIPVALRFRSEILSFTPDQIRIRAIFEVEAARQLLADSTGDSGDSDAAMQISFAFLLNYKVDGFELETLDENTLAELKKSFTRRNVPINVWPYAREFISSMTVRMGFPALVIGTHKVNV